jgi:hypothetical protein
LNQHNPKKALNNLRGPSRIRTGDSGFAIPTLITLNHFPV